MTDRNIQHERAEHLRALHHAPALLELVNVWDVTSARAVAGTPGCAALATASAAIADSHGYEDGEQIPWELHEAVLRRICSAVELPVTADLERGYGDVGGTVAAALIAGVVGVNLEDDCCPVAEMSDRISQAIEAGRSHGVPLVVNARTDVYLSGTADPEDRLAAALSRGSAYLAAGADCVFVPGCTDPWAIGTLARSLGAGRLSLLALPGTPNAATLEELGVARLSHGPFPHRYATAALLSYRARCGC